MGVMNLERIAEVPLLKLLRDKQAIQWFLGIITEAE